MSTRIFLDEKNLGDFDYENPFYVLLHVIGILMFYAVLRGHKERLAFQVGEILIYFLLLVLVGFLKIVNFSMIYISFLLLFYAFLLAG